MKGMYAGSLVIDRDTDLSGMVDGDVTIRPGTRARISGIVEGDVLIEDGAEVHIDGMVSGRILGSPASVKGMVSGR